MNLNSICDVPGISVGHAQDFAARTGCTVILPEQEVTAGVDVRGSATGTREIDLLYPTRLITKIHGLLLAGGSAFGLNAAGGVQRFLEEKNIGYDTGLVKVPIVPAAIIFDLATGNPKIRPDEQMGYHAAQNAHSEENSQGQIGAGTGATVGKLAGPENCVNGGIGTASHFITEDIVIGALVVLNALGNIVNPQTGTMVAGAHDPETEKIHDPIELLKTITLSQFKKFTNTTLAVVATNADITKEEAIKIAQMAQDGFARTIIPAHTQFDGDIIFAISTNSGHNIDPLLLGALAAELTSQSVLNAVHFSNNLN